MSVADGALRRTFRSLGVRNYRLYFTGQVVSASGTWMQTVAQAWLVLKLTNSAIALGMVTALQFLPLLLLGAWGGVLADRFEKRRLLFVTQSSAGSLALLLAVLTATGSVRLWMVYALAVLLGLVNAADMPTRQAFVQDMVGPQHVSNAVTLNSVVMNSARVIGPALAAALIAASGLATCFFVNAVSYLAVLTSLALMRTGELNEPVVVPRARGLAKEGLRYVRSEPGLRTPLLMMVAIGTLTFEFQVSLPLLARYTFGGGAGTYGMMLSLMGAGAVVGGLVVAGRRWRPGTRTLSLIASVFGVLILAVALAPGLPAALAVILPMGAASVAFIATANTTLQLRADPVMRGRVMALYSVAFLGSTPVGALIVGGVGSAFGARSALAIGGLAALAAAAAAQLHLRRRARGSRAPRALDGDAAEPGLGERLEPATAPAGVSQARLAGPARAGRRLLRQAEHPLPDDVPLDLGRATPDRLGSREEEGRLCGARRVARPAPTTADP